MKTIGERIKYFRTDRGLTQAKLAELTGIHPVSIRKYEINKMQPQLEQIERIASALNVNINAITGIGVAERPSKVQTYGDLMGILMTLYRAKVLMVQARMQKPAYKGDISSFDPTSLLIRINPAVGSLLNIVDPITENGEDYDISFIASTIRDADLLQYFALWATAVSDYETSWADYQAGKYPESELEGIKAIGGVVEELEFTMLADNTPLYSDPELYNKRLPDPPSYRKKKADST